ncbi:ATP-binding cassette domain-containing protein [Cohnella sp. GCM10012308]|uniref:ABC transporter ATP-binding protein n=1 Tax=Cohnella sp. GCM10012308 TaxID=3317329 RepID=UPI003615D0A6
MSQLEVRDLVKAFKLVRKKKGLSGSLAGLFAPRKTVVRAVDGISFRIEAGEIVGFLGPNGAGKSTTVKMMTGILHPTSGSILIDGLSPQRSRKEVVRRLGVVFGQRTQLYWDLRLGESYELLRRIYRIEARMYKANLELMHDVLGIGDLLDIPVRQLSLGQRMRGDIAAAMLHSPSVLFLDEPTIGLDIEAKHAIRRYIAGINKERGTTVILTTHDLDDVEQLCGRLVVINHGKLVEDGPLGAILSRLAPYRMLEVELERPVSGLYHARAETVKAEGHRVWLRFEKNGISASRLIAELADRYPIRDVSVKEPSIEDMIYEIYKGRKPNLDAREG